MEQSRVKVVYHITNRGGKSYWRRIGLAFQNLDGSLSVKLETIPADGEMQIRDFVERSSENEGGKGGNTL